MTTENLFAALAKAQAKIDPAPKDADNPFFKSRYATLASHRLAMRDAFADNGLSVVQIPSTVDDQRHLKTILCHSSGEQLDCGTLIGDVDVGNPQKAGSMISYFRRYALSAVSQTCTADEDDDGESAAADSRKQPPKKQGKPKQTKPKPPGPPCEPGEIAGVEELITNCHDQAELTARLKGPAYQKLKANGPADEYQRLCDLAKSAMKALPPLKEDTNADDPTPPPEPPDAAHGA